MRLLITGLNGTLGPQLARVAVAAGAQVLGWDRSQAAPEDPKAVAADLAALQPQAIAHLGFGPEAFAAQLAAHACAGGLPFLFTSTAMVFHHQPDGPHAVGDLRNAQCDYGRYKQRCEDAVSAAHADAMVVRLGWQMAVPGDAADAADATTTPGSNHMLAQLGQWLQRDGVIQASSAWRPACSFLPDTAAALWRWLQAPQPGTHHLDSNAEEGHAFDAIVAALGAAAGRQHWPVRSHADYVHDQRLAGGAAQVPPLSARLPQLKLSPTLRPPAVPQRKHAP